MSDPNKQKSLKVNATLNLIKTLMSLLFPLITFPYTSRIIGPVYIGKVNFASSIVNYFAMIAALGIAGHATRETAKVRDNPDQLARVTAEIFRINFFSVLLAYFLFFIAFFFVPKLNEYRILLLIYSTSILFGLFGMDWINNAMEDFAYITTRTIIFQIISLVLLFVFVHKKEDYIFYAAISVISSCGANFLNFLHVRKYISFKFFLKKLHIKQHIKPIMILFAMAVATQVYTIVDNSMIGFMKDDYNVGLYSAATKINRIVLSLVTAATTILSPRLVYYLHNRGFSEFKTLAYKGFDTLLLIAIPCAIGLNIVSENATLLLSGENFYEAVPVMKIMNPIIVITGLSGYIGSQIFLPLNKEKWTLISVIVGVFVNISFNAVLIPLYGAKGAAIGSLCSEAAVFLIDFILLTKLINIFQILKKAFIYTLNSAITAIPAIFFTNICENRILSLFTAIVSSVAVYLILLIIEKNELLLNTIDSVNKRLFRILQNKVHK